MAKQEKKKKEKRKKKKKNIVRQETEKQVSCVRSWRNYPAFPQKNKKKRKVITSIKEKTRGKNALSVKMNAEHRAQCLFFNYCFFSF